MDRYRHSTPNAEGECDHCGYHLKGLHPDGKPRDVTRGECRVQRKRHDAFVAAAITGLVTFAGASAISAGLTVIAAGEAPPTLTDDSFTRSVVDDAIKIADLAMAELAK